MDPELHNEASYLGERLALSVDKEIQTALTTHFTKGLPSKDMNVLLRRIAILWQIFVLQDIDGLLSRSTVDRMTNTLQDVEKAIETLKDKRLLNSLPHDLIASWNSMNLCGRDSPSPCVICHNERMDTAIYSMTDDSIDEEDERITTAISHLQQLVDAIVSGNACLESHRIHLGPFEDGLRLKMEQVLPMFDKLIPVWDSVLAGRDVRLQESAMYSLRCLLLSSPLRDTLIHNFHQMHIRTFGCLPSFTSSSQLIPERNNAITALINEMASHEELQKNPLKAQELEDKFHWLSLVSPMETVSRLLQQAFHDRRIVSCVTKLLSSSPSLCALCPPSSPCGLIFNCLNGVFDSADLTSHSERDDLVYLISSLTRIKRRNMTTDIPILSAYLAWKSFILKDKEGLFSGKEHLISFALSLIIRLFSVGETKLSLFHFTSGVGESIENSCKVRAPELVIALVDSMIQGEEAKRLEQFELSKKALKQMGAKLKEDCIVLDQGSCSLILHRLSSQYWFIKVAVIEWFGPVLREPKREIPSGLLSCLSKENTENFEQIVVCSKFDPVECFLRSLYEISLWDIPFGLTFLDKGVSLLPSEDNLVDKISLAMVDVGRSARKVEELDAFIPLTQKLIAILDPAIEMKVERMNTAIYHSLDSQRVLHVVARAVKVAYLCDGEGKEDEKVAQWLLSLFCSHAKKHLEREMEGWRKGEKWASREADEKDENNITGAVRRAVKTESVLTQCCMLFPIAVSLTHLIPKPPSCLQTLLSTMADFLNEFFNRRLPPKLDDAPTGAVMDTTVYAYVKDATPPTQSTSVLNGSTPKETPLSLSNALFNDREAALGTARAINGENTRVNVEKKLEGRVTHNTDNHYGGAYKKKSKNKKR